MILTIFPENFYEKMGWKYGITSETTIPGISSETTIPGISSDDRGVSRVRRRRLVISSETTVLGYLE